MELMYRKQCMILLRFCYNSLLLYLMKLKQFP
jgi:hypothetical protein